jgi:hypothetical protein
MQQPDRLYRYNEEVGSFYVEFSVASPDQWRDACAEDQCRVPPVSNELYQGAASEQHELQFVATEDNLSTCHASSDLVDSESIKSLKLSGSGFLSPRSPATRSCCSTPRKIH